MTECTGYVKFEDIKPGEYFRDGGRLYIKLLADPEEEFGYAFDVSERKPCMVPSKARPMLVEEEVPELDPDYVWPDFQRFQFLNDMLSKLRKELPLQSRPNVDPDFGEFNPDDPLTWPIGRNDD